MHLQTLLLLNLPDKMEREKKYTGAQLWHVHDWACLMCVAAAMLTVADPAFWADVHPVVFGTLPQLQDAVTVVG